MHFNRLRTFAERLRSAAILSAISFFILSPATASERVIAPAVAAPAATSAPDNTKDSARVFKALKADGGYRATMERWAREQAWTMSWELPEEEYSFEYNAQFQGDLRVAVNGMCAALNNRGIRARALFYPDNQVFRVVLEGTTP